MTLEVTGKLRRNWKSHAHTHIPPPPELPGPCCDFSPVVSCSAQSLDFTSNPRNEYQMRQRRSEPPRSNESSLDLITANGGKRKRIRDFKQTRSIQISIPRILTQKDKQKLQSRMDLKKILQVKQKKDPCHTVQRTSPHPA